jgi:phenylpyruvate tautomerase PptA (4-oxalocrotonate tautomerase family)
MPLVSIDLIQGKPPAYRQAAALAVHETMVEVLKVPENDRFQVIAEHAAEDFHFDPSYLGIYRSADCVFVQITLNAGRNVDTKKAFYVRLAAALQLRLGLRPQDLLVNLVEATKKNWSFGNDIAQYAEQA